MSADVVDSGIFVEDSSLPIADVVHALKDPFEYRLPMCPFSLPFIPTLSSTQNQSQSKCLCDAVMFTCIPRTYTKTLTCHPTLLRRGYSWNGCKY